MAVSYSPGDQIVCKVKDDKIVSVYEDSSSQKLVFDIVVKHNEGYLVYVPSSTFIKNTIHITLDNYKRYGVSKKFIDSDVVFITDHNILSTHSRLDGMSCKECGTFSAMATTNQEDGSFICWNCINYPFYG